MVRLEPGKITIEMKTTCPADELINKQKALIRVMQMAVNNSSLDEMYYTLELLEDLLIPEEKVAKAFDL